MRCVKFVEFLYKRFIQLLLPKYIECFPNRIISDLSHHDFQKKFRAHVLTVSDADSIAILIDNECIVARHSGVVIAKAEGSLLQQSGGSLTRIYSWGQLWRDAFISEVRLSLAQESYFFPIPIVGYYHFLVEVFPRLLQAVKLAESKGVMLEIVVPRTVPKFISELCSSIRSKALTVNFVSTYRNYIVPRVVFIAYTPPYEVTMASVHTTKSHFFPELAMVGQCANTERKFCRFLYLSRRGNKRRAVKNEIELEQGLKKIGVEIILAETLTIEEQVRLFSSADALVGLHGAGLANMIWMPTKRKVVEIRLSDYVNTCFEDLSRVCRLNYECYTVTLSSDRTIKNLSSCLNKIQKALSGV